MEKLKTIFLGTPDFATPSLEILFNHPLIDLRYVVTMPDRKSGRGQQLHSPPVALFARENKISLIQTSSINTEKDILQKFKAEKIDLAIVLAFSQFLSPELLNIPRLGCYNIHTSLLPKYRGAAPIQYALLKGDSITGVSIFKIVKKMDAGDIALAQAVSIEDNENYAELYSKLKFQSALSLNTFIRKIYTGNLTWQPQDESQISFAPTLKKEDGFIDFKNESQIKINNKVRALIPWPGCYFFINEHRYKLLEIEISSKSLMPGTLYTDLGQLLVGCADNKSIRLKSIQREGKNITSDLSLINAFKSRNETINVNP
ncbi:MAG: methionyl-tRNA formyltransferase [Bdellovibrionales bacterium RIFOXYB1_FULL_37_110]|nr:MAG: methionyl-tRNA formyltransferase [Bdellovibrionales bacterium RIFOXYA1_FULL_38_20]OFZ52249.1 MAG: methionyl-tRNA formyltransferase [Bdellovibrionales bacterium RIFOXYC1_FULL_37_79]OFZ53463.1 MAG: methionyl-tRNA formyltransferase [Bdellovibrionales bacterium RIFOXYB2_FULL_36_6]OFZ57236.1 MAG: methionyl-tRNA formyltransferase [Bdellovibrionales bacterium RIFOXYB1_FULL_37_110]OFZ65238.1 MAG: methionyl-tRNA formyltransferase [Bdellovibrionales bacterium RIFOXYD1_FULL_36_51]